MDSFKLVSQYKPTGDQPEAIDALVSGIENGLDEQVLLGVTGSGKTFTMANVIARLNRPTLVLAHNKTLAAQLCSEFKEFFPENAVEYFVSYYDYYQPEAYIPHTDTYIEKDCAINDEIDRLRLSATFSLLERRDVIVVASVSCIYGLGEPDDFANMAISMRPGQVWNMDELLHKLIDARYERNDIAFERNMFRVRGDTVEIFPAYWNDRAIRVEFFGDEIDRLSEINVITGAPLRYLTHAVVYPASHYVTTKEKMSAAIERIRTECDERVKYFNDNNKLIEAQRIKQRTDYDIDMMQELGYCTGIENYSRVISNRPAGSPPMTLLDYFPKDFLLFVDESHVTLPQVRAMYRGDRARKESLVEFGFRLPVRFSAIFFVRVVTRVRCPFAVARNADAMVIMYGDTVTPSMRACIDETARRREKQMAYNEAHGIVPKTIVKDVRGLLEISSDSAAPVKKTGGVKMTERERKELIDKLEDKMRKAAKMMEYEIAAELRDEIIRLRGEK